MNKKMIAVIVGGGTIAAFSIGRPAKAAAEAAMSCSETWCMTWPSPGTTCSWMPNWQCSLAGGSCKGSTTCGGKY